VITRNEELINIIVGGVEGSRRTLLKVPVVVPIVHLKDFIENFIFPGRIPHLPSKSIKGLKKKGGSISFLQI